MNTPLITALLLILSEGITAAPGLGPHAHPSGYGNSARREGGSPRTVDQVIQDAMPKGGAQGMGVSGFSLGGDKDDTHLVEMDMKMSRGRYLKEYKGIPDSDHTGFKGIVDDSLRWTDNTLPYEIDSVFTRSQKEAIRAGMDEWEKYTCIKFVPRTNQKNYIYIKSGQGCWSYVGMEGGRQEVSLQTNACVYHHTIVHEFGHSVGFHHEQTRYDRDDWITVNLDNINPDQAYNFDKYKKSYVGDFGIKYDYWSVMHYGVYAFSGNGGKTIVPHDERYEQVIGSVPGLSFKDIQLATIMYKCDAHCSNTCPEGAIRDFECKCLCNTGNPGKPVVEWDGVGKCPGGDDFYGETCLDYHEKCEEWASAGECAANPYFMTAQCRKSCGICGENAKCIDYDENCPRWWLIGDCDRNPGWMKMNCRKSCGVCTDEEQPEKGKCEDKTDMCAAAVKKGYCESYAAEGFLEKCPESCKVCGPEKICRNWDIRCDTWKTMGKCESEADKMEFTCPKACGLCSGGPDYPDCRNYDDDRTCEDWTKMGECAGNPNWLLFKCAKTCKVCGDDAVCMDRSPSCAAWAEYDYCENEKVLMDFMCPVTCGLCEDDTDNTDDCKNYDVGCESLAAKGECKKNPGWMLTYCPRSCGICGPNAKCKDWHAECDEWANSWNPSECQNNPGFMEVQCAVSCGTCDSNGNKVTTTEAPSTPYPTMGPRDCAGWPWHEGYCRDHKDDCGERVTKGECESNLRWMARMCPKACQFCGENAQCRDVYPFDDCGSWAQVGDCDTSKGFMEMYCPKTCGCCQ